MKKLDTSKIARHPLEKMIRESEERWEKRVATSKDECDKEMYEYIWKLQQDFHQELIVKFEKDLANRERSK
jgi:hypothetical protein